MLELIGVGKAFHHHGETVRVLDGIDLKVELGQSVAVMGASGVGKSTLLHVMGSLEPPTEGTVRLSGHDLYRLDEGSLCRLRNREIGFVFQFHHLLPEFTALENALMPALISRCPMGKAVAMAREVLGKVGLGARLTHRAGELSGGEQQRVAIARALIMKPRLVLADEPTGNLDWRTGEEIGRLLVQLNREEGMAMIIATHNQHLARLMSRQLEIAGGRIL